MNTHETFLAADQVAEPLRAWLDRHAQQRLLVELVQGEDGGLLVRLLPDVDPRLAERALVTMAKYREALMNLS